MRNNGMENSVWQLSGDTSTGPETLPVDVMLLGQEFKSRQDLWYRSHLPVQTYWLAV